MNRKAILSLICRTALFAILIGCVPCLWAQSATTGALAGTVTNPTGAAVPGAAVLLTNAATGQTQTVISGENGAYGFAALVPGTYAIRLSAPGFKSGQLDSVVVNVSETSVVNAKLEPGEAASMGMCMCEVIHTASSSSGTLVDSKTITSVPLTTRNFTQVLSMASGSAADVNNAGTLGRGSLAVNVNGNTTAGTYTINGAWATSTVPNPDTLSEFKIQTSAYDSGYGAMAPQTNVLTKGGANDFHGDLWEFNRNDMFNANAFFRNAVGQPKPNLKQNQFGGTIGGPIKKDRLFIFGSYQGTRQINALDSSSGANLVLPPLTNTRTAQAIAQAVCGAGSPATFAGGTPLNCNGSNINQIALNILQAKNSDGSDFWIPTPQAIITSGKNTGLGFSSYSSPSTYNENQYMVNTDYVISRKHTLSSKVFFSRLLQFRSFGAPIAAGLVQFTPGGPQGLTAHDYAISEKLTSTLTSNVVNEARFDFTRNNSFAWGPGIPTATSLGMTPADTFFDEPPEITIQGAFGVFRVFGNGANDFSMRTNTYQYSDNISWVHGKHTTRAGFFLSKQDNGRLDTGAARGKITFQNFTDFLLGLNSTQNGSNQSNVFSVSANEGVGPNGEVQYQYENYSSSVFLQDDIKLASRFTANFGMRWEYLGPVFDTLGTVGNAFPSLLLQVPIPPAGGTFAGETVASNYNPKMINPYTGLPFGPLPAGVVTRSTKSFYQNDTPLDAFAPRFGFAWQPGKQQKRLSMRGGYGWFYQIPTYSGNATNTPLFTAPPFAQGFGNTGASNSTSTLLKPFPTVTLGFVPRTAAQSASGTGVSRLSDRVAGPHFDIPKIQQWNVNVQYNLSSTFSLDVGYVGSKGNHLLLQRILNQPALASAAHPINCGYDGVLADCITTNTSSNAALRVPILGELPTALGQNVYGGQSWYHGLQATLRKQISRGLTFQAAYTYSKSENNTILYNDQTDISLDWSRATFDRTHRLISNFNYELPEFTHSSGIRGTLASGWSLSGIFIIQSGLPMTMTDPSGGGIFGNAATSTITLCPGATSASLATTGKDQTRLNSWFNTAGVICSAQLLGPGSKDTAYGNAGLGLVTGPGQVNTDFSLGKTTRVGGLREDAQLAFRVEFYNAFNHPQFANPGTTLGSSTFGVITLTSVAPRLIQFGLKYVF